MIDFARQIGTRYADMVGDRFLCQCPFATSGGEEGTEALVEVGDGRVVVGHSLSQGSRPKCLSQVPS